MKKRKQLEAMLFSEFLDGASSEELEAQLDPDFSTELMEKLDTGSPDWNNSTRTIGTALIYNVYDLNEE